jgi:hypothetical protein
MEQLPKIVRERLKATAGGDHPDADLLTAFAEQALPDQERSRVLLHLSRCAGCRDILALAGLPVTAADSLDTAKPAPWFQWRVLRWAAAAACVVIVGSAVLLRRDTFQLQSAKTVAVREEPKAELDAYARADRDAATSNQLTAEQAIPAAKPANKKALALSQNKALKVPVPQALPAVAAASPATPPPPSPSIVAGGQMHGYLKNQVVVGSMNQGAGTGIGGGVGGTISSKSVQTSNAATAQVVDEKKQAAGAEARQVTDPSTLGKASEVIEVEAAAPALDIQSSADKREAPGKAKAPSSAMLNGMAPAAVMQNKETRTEETVSQKVDRAKLYRAPLSRWTISSDGRLQHSIDAGQTWEPVTVAEKASFRALSANGPDVWVGGAAGLLYHSADSGASWTQVRPATANAKLTADIAAIEFTDVQHGKITTSTGDVWTTQDAGKTWSNP